ncbi:MAG: cytochrome c3 family protein [Desulfuromonadaceae bacterium]
MTLRTLVTLAAAMVLTASTVLAASHGGDIIFEKPVKGVIFSHKSHVEDKGLSCDMCHNHLFEMGKVAQEKADFVMESLYQGKYCGACHNGSLAFASNTRCATCHIGVKGQKRLSTDGNQDKKGH